MRTRLLLLLLLLADEVIDEGKSTPMR